MAGYGSRRGVRLGSPPQLITRGNRLQSKSACSIIPLNLAFRRVERETPRHACESYVADGLFEHPSQTTTAPVDCGLWTLAFPSNGDPGGRLGCASLPFYFATLRDFARPHVSSRHFDRVLPQTSHQSHDGGSLVGAPGKGWEGTGITTFNIISAQVCGYSDLQIPQRFAASNRSIFCTYSTYIRIPVDDEVVRFKSIMVVAGWRLINSGRDILH